ncbi:MAG TPA: lytic murein transglycosylase [Pseudolabrys sp.]|nr:lytic murein transglycosylase [Pseudolabrys sp.]
MRIALSIILTGFLLGAPARAADPEFQQFLQALWPEAQAKGVSREVFDAAIKDLEPDLTLPDLIIPGRVEAQPPQAEFVQPPSAYLKEATFDRLTAKGRALAVQHKATLDRIEKEFGVPGPIVLAIWGRETDYGSYKVGRDVVRVLATQAYLGNRKDMFRDELIIAFKMLQDGVPRAQMRSSWGGAMGFVQLMPSEYYLYGTDFDGDGRIDIFNSVPDSLAAAAKQLVVKGWHAGTPWAYEVRAPANADCSVGSPDHALPMAEWLKRGFVPVYGRKLSTAELAEDVSLLQPEGSYGPAFLITRNYHVLKGYNPSDLYVLFVGHLADRISDPRPFATPWSKTDQLRSTDVQAMQRVLSERGFYKDKIDGKAGMFTRAALGAYQKANGLKVDCWPTPALLGAMRN